MSVVLCRTRLLISICPFHQVTSREKNMLASPKSFMHTSFLEQGRKSCLSLQGEGGNRQKSEYVRLLLLQKWIGASHSVWLVSRTFNLSILLILPFWISCFRHCVVQCTMDRYSTWIDELDAMSRRHSVLCVANPPVLGSSFHCK